jgi:YHS domain-containing protein
MSRFSATPSRFDVSVLSCRRGLSIEKENPMVFFKKCALVLGLVLLLSFLVFPGTSMAKEQTECPVMGGLINKNIYTDYQGNRVYFCCPPCRNTFARNPELYIKKLKEQGVTLAKSPV